MKKIFILIVLMGNLMVTGCTSSQETTEKQEDTKVVYCNDCGDESNEVTKFCSECGVEAKWVAEKPEKIEETKNVEDEINYTELLACLNCKKEISNLEKENLKGYCQDCVTCDKCNFIPDKIDSIKSYEFNFKTQLCNQCELESSSNIKKDYNIITDEDIMESTDVRNNNYEGAPTTCTLCGSKNIHLERLGYFCYDCFGSYNEDTKQFEE